MGFAALGNLGLSNIGNLGVKNAGKSMSNSWGDYFSMGENGESAGAMRDFGTVATGLGSLGKLYGAWQGAKAAKDAQKQAQQSSMFTQAFDVAGFSQALGSERAKNMFMGGTGDDPKYQLNSYLSPDIQNKYMAQGLFGDTSAQGQRNLTDFNGITQNAPSSFQPVDMNQGYRQFGQVDSGQNAISMGSGMGVGQPNYQTGSIGLDAAAQNPISMGNQSGYQGGFSSPMNAPMQNNIPSTVPNRQDRTSGYGGF
jgi:hypothetical protein|tara:strand:- start:14376 stop:15137 length:762 start_codon:yes stop_codon:yes gene_type:complete